MEYQIPDYGFKTKYGSKQMLFRIRNDTVMLISGKSSHYALHPA